MTPKSGKAGSIVAPAEPVEAKEADNAEPGQVSRAESEPVTPHKPPQTEEEKEQKTWIEIKLIDQDNEPVAGAAYKVTLPDGTTDSGILDHEGFVRIEGIDPGTCKVTFPDLDGTSWKKV